MGEESQMSAANRFSICVHNRGQKGHRYFDIPIACMMFLVFSFVSADMGYVLYGADFNDRACRDAARGAAQTTNLADAINKVNAVLKSHQGNSMLMTGPSLYGPVVYQDFAGAPPPQTSPFVTVTTTTKINLPFAPISFMYGGPIFGQAGNMSFTQSYTFPIVKLK
jgi:hypothetical protein